MAVSENSPPTGRLSAPPPCGRRAALAQSAERFTRNEQVVGSIPTGGSLCCCSETFIDLNFDDLSISVERFVERTAGYAVGGHELALVTQSAGRDVWQELFSQAARRSEGGLRMESCVARSSLPQVSPARRPSSCRLARRP